jgi:hypothetical protein
VEAEQISQIYNKINGKIVNYDDSIKGLTNIAFRHFRDGKYKDSYSSFIAARQMSLENIVHDREKREITKFDIDYDSIHSLPIEFDSIDDEENTSLDTSKLYFLRGCLAFIEKDYKRAFRNFKIANNKNNNKNGQYDYLLNLETVNVLDKLYDLDIINEREYLENKVKSLKILNEINPNNIEHMYNLGITNIHLYTDEKGNILIKSEMPPDFYESLNLLVEAYESDTSNPLYFYDAYRMVAPSSRNISNDILDSFLGIYFEKNSTIIKHLIKDKQITRGIVSLLYSIGDEMAIEWGKSTKYQTKEISDSLLEKIKKIKESQFFQKSQILENWSVKNIPKMINLTYLEKIRVISNISIDILNKFRFFFTEEEYNNAMSSSKLFLETNMNALNQLSIVQEEQIEDTILEVWRSENPKSEDIN